MGVQRGFGQLQGFPICGKCQIGIRDAGDKEDLRPPPGLFRRQVFLQCPIFQAAEASEEIEFQIIWENQ